MTLLLQGLSKIIVFMVYISNLTTSKYISITLDKIRLSQLSQWLMRTCEIALKYRFLFSFSIFFSVSLLFNEIAIEKIGLQKT